MGIIKSFIGVMKVTFHMAVEEFNMMDKKFYRIGAGIIGFLVMGAFYYFFLRNMAPF